GPASFDDPYFQARTNYELMLEQKIRDLLHDIRGVRVKVSAELDPTLNAQIHSRKADGEPVAVHDTKVDDSIVNTQTDDRGRPGLTAIGPNRPTPEQAVAKNESTTTNNHTDTENFVPTTDEQRQQAGLAPQHVRAAIAIPSDFLERVWHERNPSVA